MTDTELYNAMFEYLYDHSHEEFAHLVTNVMQHHRYVYYFYHHMGMGKDEDLVYKAFENKDYQEFLRLKKKYKSKRYNPEGFVYLPDEVFDDIKEVYVPMTEDIFKIVYHYECECG